MLGNDKGRKLSIALASLVTIIGIGLVIYVSFDPNFLNTGASQSAVANAEDESEVETVLDVESETSEAIDTQTQEVTEVTTAQASIDSTSANDESTSVGTLMDSQKVEESQMVEDSTYSSNKSVVAYSAALSEDEVNSNAARNNAITYSSYISEVYSLINELRVNNGLEAVSYDGTIELAACHRAYENAVNNYFAVDPSTGHHLRPNGQKASTVAVYYGLSGAFGEVMGRYQQTPKGIIDGWINSPTHYNVLVSAKYTRVGIGVASDSNGELYWVAIFMN